jgi:hypothetical protein
VALSKRGMNLALPLLWRDIRPPLGVLSLAPPLTSPQLFPQCRRSLVPVAFGLSKKSTFCH